jgi:hypothetical protein
MALHHLDIPAVGANMVIDGKQAHSTTCISENLKSHKRRSSEASYKAHEE